MATFSNDEDSEYKRAYFDRSLRSNLVELVTACLQHRPGADKTDGKLLDQYAAEVLDPFFQRLAKDCIDKQPADPLCFMQTWAKQQTDVAQPLIDFVCTWCGSRMDEWKAQKRRLAELESQYASLKEELQTTALGFVVQEGLENATPAAVLPPVPPAPSGPVGAGDAQLAAQAIKDAETIKEQAQKLDELRDEIRAGGCYIEELVANCDELSAAESKAAKREDALRAEVQQLKAEKETMAKDLKDLSSSVLGPEAAQREDTLRAEVQQLKAENLAMTTKEKGEIAQAAIREDALKAEVQQLKAQNVAMSKDQQGEAAQRENALIAEKGEADKRENALNAEVLKLKAEIAAMTKKEKDLSEQAAKREDALRTEAQQLKAEKETMAKDLKDLSEKVLGPEAAQREDALRAEVQQLKAEIVTMAKKEKDLSEQLTKKEQDLAAYEMLSKELDDAALTEAKGKMAKDLDLEAFVSEQKEGSACVGAILRKLMSQGVTSASAAFSFFEPEADGTVTREKLSSKTVELECLDTPDITTLCEYLDPQNTGYIIFEDFKAALQRFLASSGDVHSSLTEDEFNTVMSRIKEKFDMQGLSVGQVFKDYDLDNSGTLQRNEFIDGLSKLNLGLSTKEIAQLFYAMDASGDGVLQLNEFEDAIMLGQENPLLDWAMSTFQKIAEIILQGAASDACNKHAIKPELKAMTHDGFVKLIREYDASLSLTDIGRLWCVVDKLGDSSGNADVADLSRHFTLLRMQ